MSDVPLITLPLIRYIDAHPNCTATEAMWLGDYQSRRTAPSSLIAAMVNAGFITERIDSDAIRYTLTDAGRSIAIADAAFPAGHDRLPIPAVDPGSPSVRLMRALLGACPDCDNDQPHAHQQTPAAAARTRPWRRKTAARSILGWRR